MTKRQKKLPPTKCNFRQWFNNKRGHTAKCSTVEPVLNGHLELGTEKSALNEKCLFWRGRHIIWHLNSLYEEPAGGRGGGGAIFLHYVIRSSQSKYIDWTETETNDARYGSIFVTFYNRQRVLYKPFVSRRLTGRWEVTSFGSWLHFTGCCVVKKQANLSSNQKNSKTNHVSLARVFSLKDDRAKIFQYWFFPETFTT